MKSQVLILILAVSTGCASVQGNRRALYGALVGGAAGSLGGMILSPNQESRPMNGLVFGLGLALLGGGVALCTDPKAEVQALPQDLKSREQRSGGVPQQYVVYPEQSLPDFLKNRIQPVVIEEFIEKDRVSEEGTLHEPHKVYRIKKPAELFANPVIEKPASGSRHE